MQTSFELEQLYENAKDTLTLISVVYDNEEGNLNGDTQLVIKNFNGDGSVSPHDIYISPNQLIALNDYLTYLVTGLKDKGV